MEVEAPIELQPTQLQLVSFTDYRLFLRSAYEAKKKINPRFSFRRFSLLVGFKSPNYLQMILDGQRNLTVETAEQMAPRLKLSLAEKNYFIAMVKQASAKTRAERDEAERARLVALKKILAKDIPAAKKEIFTRWYHLLVRELFLLKGAKPSPRWVVERLGGCISEIEASQSLELLCKTGFLVSKGKTFALADPVLDMDDRELSRVFMRKFHAETLRVWAQNLDRLPPAEQELGVLNIPISSAKIPELRRRIRQFQDEIIGFVQDESAADLVVQLGTYLIAFPGDD